MEHGTQAYFAQRESNARRVSCVSAALGAVMLGCLLTSLIPSVRRKMEETPVLRFGFAGRQRYVDLVQVEAVPQLDEPLIDVGKVISLPSRGGRGGRPEPSGRPEPTGSTHLSGRFGAGEDSREVRARALSPRSQLPVFQSEDLIIERLVRPEYPDYARERGIEGRVSVMALVDTLGNVIDVAVTRGSGESRLDAASQEAVYKCRFRPYLVNGRPHEVYAEFHFAFRIY
jgi:TonB family protein